MLGNLLSGFIVIVVGVNLLPTVANQVTGSIYHGGNTSLPTNVTGASASIVGLTTLFYSFGIMSAGIALTVGGLRNAGVM